MKNLSVVLNVVLLVAVGVLYFIHFSDGDAVNQPKLEASAAVPAKGKTVIAYINSDSLLSNFNYYNKVEKELNELQNKYDNDFATRAKGLQQRAYTLQQNAQNMTIAKARAEQEELMKSEANLRKYQESLTQKFLTRQAELQDSLYLKVSDYLKVYGEENNLDVVLTYQRGSGVLFASDSLDITSKVIEGLNNQYPTQEKEEKENK